MPEGNNKESVGSASRTPASARREESTARQRQEAGPGGRAVRERAGRERRDRTARSRPARYLVAAAPADEHTLAVQLEHLTVLRTLRTRPSAGAVPYLAVVETTADRAAALGRLPGLWVEPDQRLGWTQPYQGSARPVPPDGWGAGPAAGGPVAPTGELQKVTVEVTDDADRPVADAAVWLTGYGQPAVGYTGENGRADVVTSAETAADPETLWVRPARGCWPARVNRPRVTRGEPVRAVCERIVATFPGFPERALESWGTRAIGFDRLPPTHRGNGLRVVLISSGAAVSHPDLADRIAEGRDIVFQDDKTWQEDPIGSGTHLAVLVGGRDDGTGVVGLAPEAELQVCKTAPGGYCADLIEALDYCITHEADIALVATGVTEPSELLAAKVAEARRNGVACIAAAGDGAGPVAFPAALPGVLAVGAVGMLGTFPPGSGLAGRLTGPPAPTGFFVPGFANHGPGLDCCAPGVAIVSGLPPSSYGPLDGTAVAAAHVAGLAALVLGHHPRLRSATRGADRVDLLFRQILASCRPLYGVHPLSAGCGIPDAAVAMGVTPNPWQLIAPGGIPLGPAPAGLAAPETIAREALDQLDAAMWSAGLLP
jgi:subtilisin